MSHDDHLTEQQKYGIDYNDDYDYLQHLKEQSSVYHVTMETEAKVTCRITKCITI